MGHGLALIGAVNMTEPLIFGKNSKPLGKYPAIVLNNPKYSANVGAAVRAASCFGAQQVWWTGNRVRLDENERLPREERLKGYKDVEMRQFNYPFEHFKHEGVVPVAIELLAGSECLLTLFTLRRQFMSLGQRMALLIR